MDIKTINERWMGNLTIKQSTVTPDFVSPEMTQYKVTWHHLGSSLKNKQTKKPDPKSKQVSPSNSHSTQSMTEKLVKCHYKAARRHFQNVQASSGQMTWFL